MALSLEDVFRARCEARALLFQVGEFAFYDAIDVLESYARELGLNTDTATQIMADAFAPVREGST